MVGSLGRYAVGLGLPHDAGAWPWATFTVNLTGCLAMGLLVAYLVARPGVHRLARPFLGVGVLGGWTTFSAFAVDVLQEAHAEHGGLARHTSWVRCCSASWLSVWGPLQEHRIWAREAGADR